MGQKNVTASSSGVALSEMAPASGSCEAMAVVSATLPAIAAATAPPPPSAAGAFPPPAEEAAADDAVGLVPDALAARSAAAHEVKGETRTPLDSGPVPSTNAKDSTVAEDTRGTVGAVASGASIKAR